MRVIYWITVVAVLWGGLYAIFWRDGQAIRADDDVAPEMGVSMLDPPASRVPSADAAAPDTGTGTEMVDVAELPDPTSDPTDSEESTPLQGDPLPDLRGSGFDSEDEMTVVLEPYEKDGVWYVHFDYLANYPFDEAKASDGRGKASYKSQVPDHIYELAGKIVSVEGYMIPLNGLGTRVFQFYLARHNGTCCFGQPLNINDVVEVFVKDDKGAPHFYGRVRAQGKFEVGEGYDEEGYLINVYRMHADIIEESPEE